MPKLPAKKTLVVPPIKKAPPPMGPKLAFKKGVTDLADLIAKIADREGIWPRDVVKFKDLIKNHSLPLVISESILDRAHLLHRQAIRDMKQKYSYQEKMRKEAEEKAAKAVKKSVKKSVKKTAAPPIPVKGVKKAVPKKTPAPVALPPLKKTPVFVGKKVATKTPSFGGIKRQK